jgi:tetratricopeptide (TPR) repeat protein
MSLRRMLIAICLILQAATSYAIDYRYTYSPLCQKAYNHYMSLQFADGNNAIKAELKANPGNLMAVYISNYADCMLLLFNGDEQDYDKLYYHLEQRAKMMDKCTEPTPWYRLCKAGLYMQWAFIHVRMGENLKAAANFRKSYVLLKENKKRYPAFAYNDIFFGLEEAVVGTVPDDYRWIASVFGLKGDVKKGVAKINQFVATHTMTDPLYYDALIYQIYLQFYLVSQQQQVWQYINSSSFPAKDNLLFSFVKANIAINYRHAEVAIETMSQMRTMPGYKYIPAFEYEAGSALYHKADAAAIVPLQYFVKNYKGNIFVKDALYKIAQLQYLKGNTAVAKQYVAMIPAMGSAQVDADKRAKRFAEAGQWPAQTLLKATILIDGGYYDEAQELLLQSTEGGFATQSEKAEYNLRLGRVYDEKGMDDKALALYSRCIATGKDAKEYFAARAALQSGFIYEKRGQVQQAIDAYTQCLNMPVQDYRNALRQQAKAGINRLGGIY